MEFLFRLGYYYSVVAVVSSAALLVIPAGPILKLCAEGVKRGGVCYGMLWAVAFVDESDHYALMYVRHEQTVREEGVGE